MPDPAAPPAVPPPPPHPYDLQLAKCWHRAARTHAWISGGFGLAFLIMATAGSSLITEKFITLFGVDPAIAKKLNVGFGLSAAAFLPLRGLYHCLQDWLACRNWAETTLARELSGEGPQAKQRLRNEDGKYFASRAYRATDETRGFFSRMFERMKGARKNSP